ncbi:MAG: tetratricopeptide repeat protein [Alphaproteobacteria bacterium]|nr:tetratricopeptide repeat protein [Alphaproteobacteria bacterium]
MSRQLQAAIDHHRAGRLKEAESGYRLALRQQPRNADALSLLGVVLDGLGKPDEAVATIRRAVAIDPKAALFRLHLGTALISAAQYPEAVRELQLAAGMAPGMAEAHYNLGNALRLAGNGAAAVESYRAALKLAPHMLQARMNLGLALAAQQKYDEALGELRATQLAAPGNLEVQLNLANVLDQKGDYDALLAEAQKALQMAPNHAHAHFMYGLALNRLFRDEEAIGVYERALKLEPGNPEGWDNYAQSLQGAGRYDEAEAAYRKGLALRPHDPAINYHNALISLLRGNLAEGFANYRWRWQAVPALRRLQHAAPLWDGGDLQGKTILVVDEQGFGDCIMFCRYLPLLKQRGARVVYAARKPLHALLHGFDGVDELIDRAAAPETPCDCHAAIMDLPAHFGTVLDTVPAAASYLAPPPGAAPALPAGQGLRVGVVWMGSKFHKHDLRRSVPLEQFKALFDIGGATFYSLVRPTDIRDDEAALLKTLPVIDCGSMIGDFADTARIMQQLDLVISVDTAAVHLAGALGRPVWVMLPLGPDWRWLTGREDSPWYPSARLYRQTKAREWADVIANVAAALAQRAA